MINCDVPALIIVCGEQQLYRSDNECAEITTVQAGQFARCHAGNESPDSLKGYWVSPVKMVPKLPGITRLCTYYSMTEKAMYRMVQDVG